MRAQAIDNRHLPLLTLEELEQNYFAAMPADFYRGTIPWTELIGGSDQPPRQHYDSFGTSLSYWPLAIERERWFAEHSRRFCTQHPDRVRIGLIEGQGMLLPHKDHDITATLNIYLQANNLDTTTFYRVRSERVQAVRAPGARTANVFIPNDLHPLGEFSVSSGQAVLINSTEIHSVRMKSPEPRVLLSYMWTGPSYQEVLADLRSNLPT